MKKEIKERSKKLRLASDQEVRKIASLTKEEALQYFHSTLDGLSEEQVSDSRDQKGENVIHSRKGPSLFKRLFDAFINPFSLILMLLSIVTLFTDVLYPSDGKKDFSTFIIIVSMVLLSGLLRFIQESKSGKEAAKIASAISTTTAIKRKGEDRKEIPLEEVVSGDIVFLGRGDIIPADIRLVSTKDFFVSESSLNGESEPIERFTENTPKDKQALTELSDIVYMGTTVISGAAIGLVIRVGDSTMIGGMAKNLEGKKEKTSFEKGVNSISKVLLVFMAVMTPLVFLINGFRKNDWMEAFLFAVSIAVGLTPEMLPMIVTTCLAKGSVRMSRKKVIVKNLNSIQDLGAIDILCTDKTGTLTKDKVVLEKHINVEGKEDDRVLRHAFLNSYYQSGLTNLIDNAIVDKEKELLGEKGYLSLTDNYRKVDEIPFDFERRRMSVVVEDKDGKRQLITKGALEEILSICSYADYGDSIKPLDKEVVAFIRKKANSMSSVGMRVIAIAQRTSPEVLGNFSVEDEKDMVLIGFLAFFDPPKESAKSALDAIKKQHIKIKILTGDSERVTAYICSQVGLDSSHIVLGPEIESMEDEELQKTVETYSIFARLSPEDKGRIVSLLKRNGHSVGYMGDGINDTAALKAADVGISVDSASDICKETASGILLEKDLMVLEEGIKEGRKTFTNMMKYLKITASSNFGNVFSVLVASAFLPFLPMEPVHLLMLNLIYDIMCIGLPWDNVDPEYLEKPRNWDSKSVISFMLAFGPLSSIFDILTFLVLFFLISPGAAGGSYASLDAAGKETFKAVFQSGWFVESMFTQTLVILMLRSRHLPFYKSTPSRLLVLLDVVGLALATSLPYTPVGRTLGLGALPGLYYPFLLLFIAGYMLFCTVAKKFYVRKRDLL